MKIFYHSDNDGQCAGFWVKEIAPSFVKEPMKMYKMDYGISFPFEDIVPNEYVFIVDYSIEPAEMDKLLKITQNVVWIDHHITAIEKYKDYSNEIKGLRVDGVAGCMLTYCYLAYMVNCDTGEEIKKFDLLMTNDAPRFTKLIADYDVWTFIYGDDTRNFQKGFSLYPHEPDAKIWEELYDEDISSQHLSLVNTMIDQGKTITAYRYNLMKDYCEKKGFETSLAGYDNCYAVNMGMIGSDDFIAPNVKNYDVLIGFSFDGSNWNYSLRSSKVDVSEIAKKYGGGGHNAAAGFSSETLLIKGR
jgi:oligoribonuclease NrnB/cAMP/cGMP phosphodiesterase (DHH superfamily)